MKHDQPPFDDPPLKDAVKRACGGERCPEGLRQSVLGLTGAGAGSDPVEIEWWRRPMAWRVAAALVVALVGVAIWSSMVPPEDRGGVPTPVAPPVALAPFVERHDACVKDHLTAGHKAADVPQDDFQKMGSALCAKLKVPVLAADLRKDGWAFQGASLCDLKGERAAHLLFTRGKQELSVFTTAAAKGQSTCGGGEVNFCSERIRNHEVAAFVKSGGVHCMVGHCADGKLGGDEVRDLLKKHEGELVNVAVAVAGLD